MRLKAGGPRAGLETKFQNWKHETREIRNSNCKRPNEITRRRIKKSRNITISFRPQIPSLSHFGAVSFLRQMTNLCQWSYLPAVLFVSVPEGPPQTFVSLYDPANFLSGEPSKKGRKWQKSAIFPEIRTFAPKKYRDFADLPPNPSGILPERPQSIS
jgi:hypothetical protein